MYRLSTTTTNRRDNRPLREALFHFFDKRGEGAISRDAFQRGVVALNERLPEERRISDAAQARFMEVRP